jgi:hypothetical protein
MVTFEMLTRKRPYPFDNEHQDKSQLPSSQEFLTQFDAHSKEPDVETNGTPGTEEGAHVCFGSVQPLEMPVIAEARCANVSHRYPICEPN